MNREAEDESRENGIEPGGGEAAVTLDRGRPGVSPFKLYKPGQGAYVRWGTAGGAGIIVAGGAMFVYERLSVFAIPDVARYLIPVALLVVGAWAIWWMVGRKRETVDFMVSTEGEMKKVNWSSRREIIGATKVVILTLLAMGLLLFVVDLVCIVLFDAVGLLRVNLLGRMFGTD